MIHSDKKITLLARNILLPLVLLFFCNTFCVADGFTERRAKVGLKLFRTLVAADLNITGKVTPEQQLPMLLVYANDETQAVKYQQLLQADFKHVGNLPVIVQVASLDTLLQNQNTQRPAAVFVAQQLRDTEREKLVRYSIDNQVILFSPFEDDVEQGVLAGLSVQATVRPLINMKTLSAGQFNIKLFFLKVAKQYE